MGMREHGIELVGEFVGLFGSEGCVRNARVVVRMTGWLDWLGSELGFWICVLLMLGLVCAWCE